MDRTSGWMVGLAAAAALDEGARAPGLRGRALAGGETVSVASHRGSVVALDFWASRCEPCARVMPALGRRHPPCRSRGLVVIGASEDRQRDDAKAFLRRTRVSFPAIFDEDHSVANRYRPPTMPSTFIIDRHGGARHVHAGFRPGDATTLERQIRDLL